MSPNSDGPSAHLLGKVALVTGATAGIGFHTARALAVSGATVFITGRDERRGREAVTSIRQAAGHERVELVLVDHATIGANRRLADQLASRLDHLDVLVNNVGAISAERLVTEDGIERTLAVNFLAPFVLTEALRPLLASARPARVVNVVSSSFTMVKTDPFCDLASVEHYVGITAHGRAKLLTLLWSLDLARRVGATELAVVAVNPGAAWTPMTQSLTRDVVPAWKHVFPIVRFFQRRRDPAVAARNCVRLVHEPPSIVGGRYFDGRKPKDLPPRFADPALAERARLVGQELSVSDSSRGGTEC